MYTYIIIIIYNKAHIALYKVAEVIAKNLKLHTITENFI